MFRRAENGFDAAFGPSDNPLRHLGALGFFFLWVLVASGLYLYIVVDTSVVGVYRSIDELTKGQWYFGGILRSLHRYATDAFILVMMLHLVREWAYDRYSGFRLYSWATGIPLIWFAYMSGIGGYWIVWDRLAQFSAVASMEMFDWFTIFNQATVRNFLSADTINDRFFTFLVFLHIGIPLLLILGLWAHVHRISRVDALPSRRLGWGSLLCLLALALVRPAVSDAPADLAQAALDTRIDWFVLFLHPLTYATSAAFVWALLFAGTILLFALPLLPHTRRAPVAEVDPPNCNGCRRCYVDCPYGAVTMEPHPFKPRHQIAVVDAANCAGCGICVGACPSSTPFRSNEKLVTGIDMPQQPIDVLRHALEERLTHLAGQTKVVVFGCESGADVSRLAAPDTAAFTLICAGMLPPSFVEYALRGGADGVLITGCRPDGCPFRFGNHWLEQRLSHRREPHLRTQVPALRVRQAWAGPTDEKALEEALHQFRRDLEMHAGEATHLAPFHRRTIPHGH